MTNFLRGEAEAGQFSKTVALSGASGFLGKNLLARLSCDDSWTTIPLFRSAKNMHRQANNRAVYGDLLHPDTINSWLSEGCTVVHAAYMWRAGRVANLQATAALVQACRLARVRRLVHISTAAVSGRAPSSWVDEETPCCPVSEYGQTKLEIERFLLESALTQDFDLVILRPTSVYGPHGTPLLKLYKELKYGSWPKNYLRASLFGRRAMNLVHIDYVVAAIRFVIEMPKKLNGKVFIVSEDDASANNFHDVENMARQILGVEEYPLPIFSCPPFILERLLRILGRNIVDPSCRFSDGRLKALGFESPHNFEKSLREYFTWAHSTLAQIKIAGSR